MSIPNNAGSSILNEWRAKRQAEREVQASTGKSIPISEMVAGTEGYGWLAGGLPRGRSVSERSAMAIGAVYACVSLIGGALGQLVLQTYTVNGDLSTPVRGDMWHMLNEEMHPRWSAALAWEFSAQALLLRGNLYMRLHRPSIFSAQIESIEPLHPLNVSPMLHDDRLIYQIVNVDGTTETVDQDDMIHVPGPGFDGLRGMSQIQHVLRQPVSTALASNEVAENILTDGLRPDIVLSTDAKVDRDQVDLIREQWRERYSGLDNSNAPVVIGGGLKVSQISMTAADAQLLEREKLSVEEVARIFGVPPYMVGQLEKQTSFGNGLEQLGTGFVRYTLGRHMTKIEQEFNRKTAVRGKSKVAYDATPLLRGDTKSRYDAYRSALGRAGEPGWMSKNEVRRAENLPPVADGDTLFNGAKNAEPATQAAE
ncbi:phage portal protein [Burkholderia ubonensis]|uniref:Phage portal protein n=1 Tax=Burkholderia ubonensis subsp. mesacidophila TaxID=265293 RepID=A0A2A4FJF9_9BURK|nr:phage portal protein [Burkholderia ubonensis]PCE32810.1 phage portal protein [Burkholderia ubonensis subsp. mesacidophila]